MKRNPWIVDILCAATGAALIWMSCRHGTPMSVYYLGNWIVYLAMVIVPLIGWVRVGNSTIVGETATRYFSSAKIIFRDPSRRAPLLILAIVLLTATTASLQNYNHFIGIYGRVGAVPRQYPGPGTHFRVTMAGPLQIAGQEALDPSTGGRTLYDPFFFGAAFILLLPYILSFLKRNREQPGWDSTRWPVIALAASAIFVGLSIPWVRASLGISPFAITPFIIIFGIIGALPNLAAWCVVRLLAFDALLLKLKGRQTDVLPAFAGLFGFSMAMLLVNSLMYLPLWLTRRTYGTTTSFSPSFTVIAFIVVCLSLVSLAVLWVPPIIALHGVGIREALRRNFIMWARPWRVGVFVASLALIIIPVIAMQQVLAAHDYRSLLLYSVKPFFAVPFKIIIFIIFFAAIGTFVLENQVPEEQVEVSE